MPWTDIIGELEPSGHIPPMPVVTAEAGGGLQVFYRHFQCVILSAQTGVHLTTEYYSRNTDGVSSEEEARALCLRRAQPQGSRDCRCSLY
ncbi:MAG: hypothetical protein HY611_02225 [Elusimicrobia bacterium]|nr:hypothetical protein [Elusimicrobiota bacterium]